MKVVRLFVSQDNRSWYEDIPYGDHLERTADLEMSGGHVYHASLITPTPAKKRRTSTAKLQQRLY
jgi:hypothetical protein